MPTLKVTLQWLAGLSVGLSVFLRSLQLLNTFDVQEETQDRPEEIDMDTAVDEIVSYNEPYLLGSARINAVLQNILSSDFNQAERAVYLRATHLKSKRNYALGSETLNQILEDLMMQDLDTSQPLIVEPAVEL